MRTSIVEAMKAAHKKCWQDNAWVEKGMSDPWEAALDAALEVMMEPEAVANLSAAILVNVLRAKDSTEAPIAETLAKHFTTLKGQP